MPCPRFHLKVSRPIYIIKRGKEEKRVGQITVQGVEGVDLEFLGCRVPGDEFLAG